MASMLDKILEILRLGKSEEATPEPEVEEGDDLEERAEEGRQFAEAANEALPESLSGRQAVLRQRDRLSMIDQMLREAGQ